MKVPFELFEICVGTDIETADEAIVPLTLVKEDISEVKLITLSIPQLLNTLNVKDYKLEEMYNEMIYINYKVAEKNNFVISPETYYKNIITNTYVRLSQTELQKIILSNQMNL